MPSPVCSPPLVQAVALLGRVRPAVVISVGGYASVAGALAAVVWRVPLVVAEQNAVPGLANRLAGRFAAACAVSFPGTPLRRAVVTGNPVRRPDPAPSTAVVAGRAAARAALGLPADRFVVAVAGGSLGARRINQAVLDLAAQAGPAVPDVAIRHVSGTGTSERLRRHPPRRRCRAGSSTSRCAFEDRMELLLSAADVAVQRAGASTVAELTVAGLPAILVPLPGAPGDHQTANARRLAAAGRGGGGAGRRARRRPARPSRLERLIDDGPARQRHGRRGPVAGPAGGRRSGRRPGRGARSWLRPLVTGRRWVSRSTLVGDAARGRAPNGIGAGSNPTRPDLSRPRRVHIVGIGGAGMSAIATVLLAMGHQVSGSDAADSDRLRRLAAGRGQVHVGHDPGGSGTRTWSRVHRNPLRRRRGGRGRAAGACGCGGGPRLLAAICRAAPDRSPSAGTHGKTSTSAMLAVILRQAGLRPTYIIGGDVVGLGSGAAWESGGEWLVVEADESDGTFLELGAEAVVVTSVEPDHLDFYGDEVALRQAFVRFVEAAPGPRVVCADDRGRCRCWLAPSSAAPGRLTQSQHSPARVRPSRPPARVDGRCRPRPTAPPRRHRSASWTWPSGQTCADLFASRRAERGWRRWSWPSRACTTSATRWPL